MDYNLEITKILAKIMQNNMKKKEINEILSRVMHKMEYILTENDTLDIFLDLKNEYDLLLKDINKYL